MNLVQILIGGLAMYYGVSLFENPTSDTDMALFAYVGGIFLLLNGVIGLGIKVTRP